ncbi:hypothetical protein NHJ13734_002783 [Beauveria thailandica]
MKFVIFASLIASVLAVPAELAPRTGSSICPAGLYSSLQCCATILLNVVGIDCKSLNETPRSAKHFTEICATKGQQAACCVAPVAGQAILCQAPAGA